MSIIHWLGDLGVVPVVRINKAGEGPLLAATLLKGRLRGIGITRLTQAAAAVIRGLHGPGGAG